LLIGLLTVTGIYLRENQTESSHGEVTLIIKSLGVTKIERFKFSEGTALGLLSMNHSVKTMLDKDFIICIDGVCADKEYYWLFYVNNKTINYGAKRYRLKDKDVIKFEFTNRNIGGKTWI